MPDDLAAAVKRYDDEVQDQILDNWDAIGDEGRGQYRRYLDKAWTKRGRRERCRVAAEQLVNPGVGFSPAPPPFGVQ